MRTNRWATTAQILTPLLAVGFIAMAWVLYPAAYPNSNLARPYGLQLHPGYGPARHLLVQSSGRFALEIADSGIAAWYDLQRDPDRRQNLVAAGAHLLEHRSVNGELLQLSDPVILEDTAVRSRITWQAVFPSSGETHTVEYTIWAGGQIAVNLPGIADVQTSLQRDAAAITGAALNNQPVIAQDADEQGHTAMLFLDSWNTESALPFAAITDHISTASAALAYDAQTGAIVTGSRPTEATRISLPQTMALRQPRFELAGWTSPDITVQRANTVLVEGHDYLAAWNEQASTVTVQYLHTLSTNQDEAARTFNFIPMASGATLSLTIPGKNLDENGMLVVDGNMPDSDGTMSTPDTFSIPYIQSTPQLNVAAAIQNAPAGAKVEFVLTQSNGTQQSIVDGTAPYAASFTMTVKGEHRVDAYVQDSAGNRISGAEDSINPVGYGNIIVAIGDSITAGERGNAISYGNPNWPVTSYLKSPESSDDNRNIYQYNNYGHDQAEFLRGYPLKLNNNLTGCTGVPVFIMNDGFGGIRTARGEDINLLDKQAYYNDHIDKLGAQYVLLGIGTNDVNAKLDAQSWKADMHKVIDALQSPNYGLGIWVAPLPGEQGDTPDPLFAAYNALIPEIVTQQNTVANPVWQGPDFYSHFQANPDHFGDWLHPNQDGYDAMADMWSTTICATLSNPPFIPTATTAPTKTLTPMAIATNTLVPGADTPTPVSSTPPATAISGEQEDPVAYWQLEETGGLPFYDSTGGNHGTTCPGNCPESTSGQIGKALLFNGDKTGIDVPPGAAFNWATDDSFSLGFWTRSIAGRTCSEGNEVMIGRDDDNSKLHWWLGCLEDGRVHLSLKDVDGNGAELFGPVVNDGAWHQIAVVRDGDAGMTRLYVNGVQVDSAAFSHTFGFDSATAPLNIGWLNIWPGYHYQGTLDDIALYNRALAAGEVAENYQNGLQGEGWAEVPAPTPAPGSTTVGEPTATATAGGDSTPVLGATATAQPKPTLGPSDNRATVFLPFVALP